VGAISVGLLSVGALGIGVIGLGTIGVGLLTIGSVSIGVKAYAWLSALGWETAQGGGFAIARIAAEGRIAFAQHANDPIARSILADPNAERNMMIFLMSIALLAILPTAAYAQAVRHRMALRGKKTAK
jgi:hypothetical protein